MREREHMQTLFFRRKTDAGKHEFVPGEVITKVRGVVNVCFQEQLAEAGEEIDLYHRKTDNFMRQTYVVEEVTPTGVDYFMKLRKIGLPVYAGFRWAQRIPTPGEEITADLGDEAGLQVLDISETGLSVESNRDHPVGTTMQLHFHFNRLHLEGDVTVRAVQPVEDHPGWFRYGLRCEPGSAKTGLVRMLPKIAVALQVKRLESSFPRRDPDPVDAPHSNQPR
jgi:hypothetical protein